ncbi:MAG: phosphopantetheine-binding protein [Treponema sp.]|jgi:acyl carrier protein|nr:phosphopantetheine-binding protein [Treponema sp.]
MNKEEIFNKMQELLSSEFKIDKNIITPEARLYDDLELDSIDAVDLLVQMKEFIPGKIDPEMFKKAVTVQDVIELLFLMTQKN